jgi:transposase-like protein
MCDLTNPAFTDEDKARKVIEASRWPNGATCPCCGLSETVSKLGGESMGPGWYHCRQCREKFTVRTGTLYERSHIPLHKWLLATHLLTSSKKGMSAHQLWRMLGFGSYRTAWFMAHRIREGMTGNTNNQGGLGGANKVVEADETYVGGKAKNRAYKPEPKKHIVMTLVERGGEARSFHVKNATAKTLRETAVNVASLHQVSGDPRFIRRDCPDRIATPAVRCVVLRLSALHLSGENGATHARTVFRSPRVSWSRAGNHHPRRCSGGLALCHSSDRSRRWHDPDRYAPRHLSGAVGPTRSLELVRIPECLGGGK